MSAHRHRDPGHGGEDRGAGAAADAARHHGHDRARAEVGCGVVTVSDSRTPGSDRSGALIRETLERSGHPVRSSVIVLDESAAIRAAVSDLAARDDVAAIIVTGGTGIAARDVTIESLAGLWSKEIPGFGELFRALSFAEIGSASFLSRAAAGVVSGTFVALLPGSPRACKLAMERLILPELGHVAGLLAPSP
jgi:molybdopterin adenylyltransferase